VVSQSLARKRLTKCNLVTVNPHVAVIAKANLPTAAAPLRTRRLAPRHNARIQFLLAQRIRPSQMAEEHGHELRPTGEALGVTLGLVLADKPSELGSRKMVLKGLTKEVCSP